MKSANPTRQARIKANSAGRRELQKQELRRTILHAATQLFEQHGYDGFSLRQVAEAIGYSPTTIYLYFKDKDDLLFAVCSQGFIEFTQALKNAFAQHTDSKERIAAMGRAYLEFGLRFPLHYQVMFMQRAEWVLRSNQANGSGTDKGESSYQIMLEAVVQAMKTGVLRVADPVQTTNLLWSGLHGLVSLHIGMQGVVPQWEEDAVRRLLDRYMEVVLVGLVG